MPPYKHYGPVRCDIDFDTSNLSGKTAIVTGGANGIGEAYVRALVGAGVSVCIGDLDVSAGEKLAAEFSGKIQFTKCNTSDWEDQVSLFQTAASFSPTGKIHYVVANAGIARQDEVFENTGVDSDLKKPDLLTIDVNIVGTLYTTKLATHYFIKQNGQTVSDTQEDTCLILIGSGAAFVDSLRMPQYNASKWAARGIMHALRRVAYHYGSRINVISPWYVRQNQDLAEEVFDHLKTLDVEIATAEDAGSCLLRILSDPGVNGHSFFVSARRWASKGYIDLDVEDYLGNDLIQEIQVDQMKGSPAEAGLYV